MKQFLLLSLLLFFSTAFAQKVVIHGNVSDNTDVLVGVSIVEKGTTNGTSTDFDGDFSINVNENSTIIFSYIGYKTQEIAISGKQTINIILEEDNTKLDAVVVKGFSNVIGQARRRAESVQNIPESVVTFTSESIEAKGIENIQTFSDHIPNVNFTTSQNIGNNFITVRGISHIRNGDSPIAFVIDGVTLPDANLISQELFDVALIEVVKGPQGALYGKNAIAGAINVITNEPTNYFKNKIQFGYGNGNTLKSQILSTGPLVKDKLFYRISGSYKKGDGLLNNNTLNKAPDFIEDLSLRAQIKAKLSSRITSTLTAQIIDAESGAVYYASPTTGNPTISPDNFENLAIQGDQFGESTLDAFYTNLKLKFNFNNMMLTSLTTYNKGERNHIGDLDFTPADVLRQIQDSNTKTFNQELRLSSTNAQSKIAWDLGAFYQKLDKQLITDATADFGYFVSPFQPTGTQTRLAIGNFTNTYNTYAVFGFIDYKISDRFSISSGFRYDNDNIQQDNVNEGTNPERTDSQFQPKISFSYNISEETLLYANYGKGYRTGGLNQGETVRYMNSFEPEFTDNYELGLKNSFWNDRFIFNLSGYFINFKNQQLYALVLDGANGAINIGNFNVPESESNGFEADIKLRASKYFDILASYGISDSKIKRGTSTVSTGTNETIDVSGKNTPLIPQNSYSFAVESSFDISDNIAFSGNVNLKGTGKIYWHEDNAAASSAYSLLNSRVGLTFNDNLTVSVWGRNVLGEDYITEFFAQTFSNGGSDLAWLGQPATFGVNLSYKF